MKHLDINKIKSAIENTIIISTCVVLAFALLSMSIAHHKVQLNKAKFNEQKIDNILSVYRSNLSQQLAIVASSTIFVDYLNSGEISRNNLFPQFLYQIKNLNTPSIVGMSIERANEETIFAMGKRTPYHITLNLCYLNRALNDEYGICNNTWTLFFDPEHLFNSLKNINRDLYECPTCQATDLLASNTLGNFDIEENTPLIIHAGVKTAQDYSFWYYIALMFVAFIGLIFWIRNRIKFIFNKYIANPLNFITSHLKQGLTLDHQKDEIQEFAYLIDQIEQWKKQLETLHEKEKEAEIGRMLKQIVHDIRSPLTAIDVITQELSEVEETKRTIIKNAVDTLKDLANNILSSATQKEKRAGIYVEYAEPVALLLERIISEKRVQIAKNISLSLEIKDAHSLFAKIDNIAFKRVISNMINNALEAIQNQIKIHGDVYRGTVNVTLSESTTHQIQIEIIDNGCGIAPENLEKILQGGVSIGKEDGLGIGLSSSKKMIESFGGSLEVASRVNEGTTMTIRLPIAPAASWFPLKISLPKNAEVIILDDDKAIHALWDMRFKTILHDEDHITVQHFYAPEPLMQHPLDRPISTIFGLIDYELMNKNITGIDVIKQLHLEKTAILVTSRYENVKVREEASTLGIKILPKSFAPYIDIEILPSETQEIVFIDDDEALTSLWQLAGKTSNKQVHVFNRSSDFTKMIHTFKKDTPIYIDSSLAESIRGEDFAKELYDQGFSELYLATGYDADHFKPMPWIKKIVGKNPPF